jgi:hypothetical protein
MARAGIRLWAASSSDVWPYPGSAMTRGHRCRPSSPAGTANSARRPRGNARTTVPAARSLRQLGLGLGDGVASGVVVRTAVGTTEVGAGFCPRETVPAGDPAQPATANSSRNVAPRGRKCIAPASLTRACLLSGQWFPAASTARPGSCVFAWLQISVPIPCLGGRLANGGSGRQNLFEGGAPHTMSAADRGTLLWRAALARVPFSGISLCPPDRVAPEILPRAIG